MLEGLDAIDWNKLQHAYGEAGDVPELIRSLRSTEEQVRENALHHLYGNIWHQGTVYEATAYAVPFLIELLEAPVTPDYAAILQLLQTLACGNSYLDAHQTLDWYRSRRDTPEFKEQLERELGYVKAAHEAVAKGIPVYTRFFDHPDFETRYWLSLLLMQFPERLDELEPVLLDNILWHDQIKEGLIFTLTCLWERLNEPLSDDRVLRLVGWMRAADETLQVRARAAIMLVRMTGETYLDEALPLFDEVITRNLDDYSGNLMFTSIADDLSDKFPDVILNWLLRHLDHPDPAVRRSLIFSVRTICQRWRFAPSVAVPHVLPLLDDTEEAVRALAVTFLRGMGKAGRLAHGALIAKRDDPSQNVRQEIQKALDRFEGRGAKRAYPPVVVEKTLPELLNMVVNTDFQGERLIDVIFTLKQFGKAAHEAIPFLLNELERDDQWERVTAAQALWMINQGPVDKILPVLIDELRVRPVGLIAAETLGQMGKAALPAVPRLREIIASKYRLNDMWVDDFVVDDDEAFCDVVEQALRLIEGNETSPDGVSFS